MSMAQCLSCLVYSICSWGIHLGFCQVLGLFPHIRLLAVAPRAAWPGWEATCGPEDVTQTPHRSWSQPNLGLCGMRQEAWISLKLCFFICLFECLFASLTGRVREMKEAERDRPSSGSFSEWLKWLGLGHNDAGSQELHPGVSYLGDLGPSTWANLCCFFQAASRELGGNWNSQYLNSHPQGLLVLQAAASPMWHSIVPASPF